MPTSYALETHYFDVVIVGAGGAGLMAATKAAQKKLSVACVSKVEPTRSHTVAAQGGINAALGNVTADDWRWHMYDTIRGSDWLADQDAVEFMCRNAAGAIRDLEHLGVPFSRQADGRLYQRVYGGQSSEFGKGEAPPRACAVADRTGHAILHTLHQQSLRLGVRFFVEHFALDLIMDEGTCRGVVVWDIQNGLIRIFRAHSVILATGGYGQAFATNTSSSICTGDGNAMALRAGLALQDMEFVQSHPTGLYGSGLLITEAARAEGAYLINGDGERFMERYAPGYKDLAPRDVIARAMATELLEGRGAGEKSDHLLLCLQHMDEDTIRQKLPTVCETAQAFARVNPLKEPIPVLPSVHYTMGGVPTNRFSEVVTPKDKVVPGLMAIGETACTSVHGANRLGCNSLLELIVFGSACIDHLGKTLTPGTAHKSLNNPADKALQRLEKLRQSKGDIPIFRIKTHMTHSLSRNAGVFRNHRLLSDAVHDMRDIMAQLAHMKVRDRSLLFNNQLLEALELSNLAAQGLVTAEAALARRESRGCHYREDYPDRNDTAWLKHSLIGLDAENEVHVGSRGVRLETCSADVPVIKPEKRKY